MCDPCGVKYVWAGYRGLAPTAIHVVSLRDTGGRVKMCLVVFAVWIALGNEAVFCILSRV